MLADRLKPAQPEFMTRDRAWQTPSYAPAYKTTVLRSPRNALLSLQNSLVRGDRPAVRPQRARSARQRSDPELRQGWRADRRADHRARPGAGRERARACRTRLIEFWQANAGGRYRHRNDNYVAPIDPNFGGCGRTMTRRERLLLLPHHQARSVSLAQLTPTAGGRHTSISRCSARASCNGSSRSSISKVIR